MRHARRFAGWPWLLAFWWPADGALAQRLSEQYDHYLANQCANLGFARSEWDGSVAPGQAGPNLAQFCSRLPVLPSVPDLPPGSTIGTSVPGAGALGGADAGRGDDQALRRRRDEALERESEEPAGNNGESVRWTRLGSPLALFLSLDAERQRQRGDAFEDGRRGLGISVTAGGDYRLRPDLVAGLALRGERLGGDFDGGGDYRTRSLGAAIYAGWLATERSFLDLSAVAARQRLHSERIVARQTEVMQPDGTRFVLLYHPPPAAVAGRRSGRELRLNVLWGHDSELGRHTFGPRVGLAAQRLRVDAFTEEGATPMALRFDAQSSYSLQSALGLQLRSAFASPFGVIVPQVHLDWLHEFRDDARIRTVRFAEDLRDDPVVFGYQTSAPDRDFLLLRTSAVAVLPHGWSLFGSLHRVLQHRTRRDYGAALGLRLEY